MERPSPDFLMAIFLPACYQKNLATKGFTAPFHLWVYYWKIPVDSHLWSHGVSPISLFDSASFVPVTGAFAYPFPSFLLAKPVTPVSCSLPQYLQSILWIFVLSWRLQRKPWEQCAKCQGTTPSLLLHCLLPWPCPGALPLSTVILSGLESWLCYFPLCDTGQAGNLCNAIEGEKL